MLAHTPVTIASDSIALRKSAGIGCTVPDRERVEAGIGEVGGRTEGGEFYYRTWVRSRRLTLVAYLSPVASSRPLVITRM